MKSVFHDKDQVFQLYPLKIEKIFLEKIEDLFMPQHIQLKKKLRI